MPARHPNRFLGVLVAILLATVGGCAGPDEAASETGMTPVERGAVARSLLGGTDHGLQVRKWHAVDDGSIGALLHQFASGPAADEDTEARLRSNGLRIVRIRVEDVERLQAALGGTPLDLDGWLGQVTAWRAVTEQSLDEGGDAFAVDGRVRRFPGGQLRLEARGWTLLMESGPVLQLELRAAHEKGRGSRLEQVLGREAFHGELFPSITSELTLEADYAYIITCESPAVAWVDEDDHGDGGGAGAVGPGVITPLTVGERLLKVEMTPVRRELILFIPRIPSGLYPIDAIESEA